MKQFFSRLKWKLRTWFWSVNHVDDTSIFSQANNTEKLIWKKIRTFLSSISRNEKIAVLEIGAANGRNLIEASKFFNNNNFKFRGIDLNFKAIKEGTTYVKTNNLKNVNIQRLNVTKMTSIDEDIVVCIATMLYLSPDELHSIVDLIIESDVKIVVVCEPIARDLGFQAGANYYHAITSFKKLDELYSSIDLKIHNESWDTVTGVRTVARAWVKKNSRRIGNVKQLQN